MLHERGYQFFLETPTNQQFVILPNEDMARIREHASIEYWEKYDETHTVGAFLHQLGHDAGGHRRAGGCPVA